MGSGAGGAPPPSSSTPYYPTDDQRNQAHQYWGAHVMGTPNSVPTTHPNNHNSTAWSGGAAGPNHQFTPTQKPTNSPMVGSVLKKFNSWSAKAETTAANIWHNLKTGPSVSESAMGKVNLTAKALTGGGFETLYKQTFTTYPHEKLNKTFACYLSTSTGPLAGTLYLSNVHVAFCSDRPLSFTEPSGQQTWNHYKVMVPLGKIQTINPVSMKENSSDKYIQICMIDGHDLWFMGFVNHEKAAHHLFQNVSAASGVPVHQTFA